MTLNRRDLLKAVSTSALAFQLPNATVWILAKRKDSEEDFAKLDWNRIASVQPPCHR